MGEGIASVVELDHEDRRGFLLGQAG
jgi:hypothetical protein